MGPRETLLPEKHRGGLLAAFHRFRRDEEGQVIVLAAVSMLVLALGTLATVNLGFATREKMRLQNNADTAAYSLATLEARTFNYYSFVNRAMVANYVSMMAFASLGSYMAYMEAMMATAAAKLLNIGWKYPFPYQQWRKPFWVAGKNLRNALKSINSAVDNILKAIKSAVKILGAANKAMSQRSTLLARGMNAAVLVGMTDVIKKQDKDMNIGLATALTGALNIMEYNKIFDSQAYTINFNTTTDAQRIMAELANGTRWPTFVSCRSIAFECMLSFGSIGGIMAQLGSVASAVSGIMKNGQTRIIDEPDPRKMHKKVSGCPSNHPQCFPSGKALVAQDIIFEPEFTGQAALLGFFVRRDYTKVASISMQQSKGEVCRAKKVKDIYVYYWPDAKCESDNDLKFPGMVPYTRFKPNDKPNFNQPNTWIILNKSDRKLQREYQLNFTYTDGVGKQTEVDMRPGAKGVFGTGLGKGLNALSRGMAYYHRTGNWQEHPNFFNPYWRARLVPIGELTRNAIAGAGLPGGIAKFISDNLITH